MPARRTGLTSPPRLLCLQNSPGHNTGVGSHSLLQGIFPTQGVNPGLLHCRQILYHLGHQGHPQLTLDVPGASQADRTHILFSSTANTSSLFTGMQWRLIGLIPRHAVSLMPRSTAKLSPPPATSRITTPPVTRNKSYLQGAANPSCS